MHYTQPYQFTRKLATASSSDFNWTPIISLYCIYFLIIMVGEIIGYHATIIGASIFLVFLYVWYWIFLFRIKFSFLVYCIIMCLLIPIVPMIFNDLQIIKETYSDVIKYYALHLIILLGLALRLTPLGRARMSRILYIIILAFLLIGWAWKKAYGIHEPWESGFLPNPNNFALTAMILFFLVDYEIARSKLRYVTHLIVVALIYISHTSGSLLGYLLGTIYNFTFSKENSYTREILLKIASVSAVFLLVLTVLLNLPKATFKPIDTLIKKVEVAEEGYHKVISDRPIDFYSIIEEKKEDVTSGLWRLYEWHKMLTIFSTSPTDKILFGYGIGTSEQLFKFKPHNDYLRIFLEAGIIGFAFNMLVWIIIYRRMTIRYRWVVVMIAVFCIMENNYDHFPAMSLLIFYMLGAYDPQRKKEGSGFSIILLRYGQIVMLNRFLIGTSRLI